MKTTNEIFAENLRNKLYAKNKTQAELAKFLGVSQVIVSRRVNGTATPRHEKIDKICLFLNCNREEKKPSSIVIGKNYIRCWMKSTDNRFGETL